MKYKSSVCRIKLIEKEREREVRSQRQKTFLMHTRYTHTHALNYHANRMEKGFFGLLNSVQLTWLGWLVISVSPEIRFNFCSIFLLTHILAFYHSPNIIGTQHTNAQIYGKICGYLHRKQRRKNFVTYTHFVSCCWLSMFLLFSLTTNRMNIYV